MKTKEKRGRNFSNFKVLISYEPNFSKKDDEDAYYDMLKQEYTNMKEWESICTSTSYHNNNEYVNF